MSAACQRLRAVVATALLMLSCSAVAATEDYGALLQRADTLRSADPATFATLLDTLESRRAEASGAQQEMLRYLQAYALAFGGDFAAANEALRALYESSSDDTIRYRAALSIANNSAVTREFAQGFRALDDMLALMPAIEDAEQRRLGLLAAAIFLNQAGQYEQGQAQALRLLQESPGPRAECFGHYLALEALMQVAPERLDDGRFDAAVARCIAAGERVATNLLRAQYARHQVAHGQRAAAIDLLQSNLDEVEASRYPVLIAEVQALLADLLFESGDIAAARGHAEAALVAGASTPSSLPLVTANRVLYQAALAEGNLAAALDHYRRFAEADKAYLDHVKTRELAYQMARHESEQKTQTIALLNKQNEVLQLEQEVSRRTTESIALLAALLGTIALLIGLWAFKVKRLQIAFRTLAETDALTGLSNRHHFSRSAEQALARCRRAAAPAALIMFDLDHFKSINDRFGHTVGDWVLRQAAQVAQSTFSEVSSIGRVGRIGGEEFAILLPDHDAGAALSLAERCRTALASIDCTASGSDHAFPISASFGIADSNGAGYELHTLLTQADQAMYRAKVAGRDRVERFDNPGALAAASPVAAD